MSLSDRDCRDLARLQAETLPSSMLSRLGVGYLRHFWRFCDASPVERILLLRDDDGRVVAASLASLDPGGLSRRLAVRTTLFLHVWRVLPDLLRGGKQPQAAPELVLLFTDPAHRGSGLAGRLVAATAQAAREAGRDVLYVRTFDDDAHPAVRFYAKQGFVTDRRFQVHGQAFRLLRLDLGSAPTTSPPGTAAAPR